MALCLCFQNNLLAQKRQIGKIGLYILEPLRQQLDELSGPGIEVLNPIPPLTLERERSFLPFLSFGTEVGFSKWALENDGYYGNDYRMQLYTFWTSFKAIGHFKIGDIFEIYAIYGLRFTKNWIDTPNPEFSEIKTSFGPGILMNKFMATGVNLSISETFGIFVEAGLQEESGLFKLGIIYKK